MNRLKKWLPLITVILVSAYPVIFLWSVNVRELSFFEILPMLSLYIVIGSVCWLIIRFLLKSSIKASLLETILFATASNFSLITTALSISKRTASIAFVIIAIMITLFFLKHAIKSAQNICTIISLTLSALIIVNIISAMPIEIHNVVVRSTLKKNNIVEQVNKKINGSNIYYLLCDEYAGFDQMEYTLGFDNMEFKNFLLNNNFNISLTSKNANTTTTAIISNLMQLEYKADQYSTGAELKAFILNSRLLNILKSQGYSIRGVGNTEWMNIKSNEKGENGAKAMSGENLGEILRNQTIFARKQNASFNKSIKLIQDSLKALNQVPIEANHSTFTFFYVSCPHPPFFFYEDGTIKPSEEWYNEDDQNESSYIDTVKYLNSQLIPAVTRIIEKDPQSIIIVCSDHGLRMTGKSDYDEKRTILNAVYYKGEQLDELEGKSSVNTMRMLLNYEFDLGLEYLDVIPR